MNHSAFPVVLGSNGGGPDVPNPPAGRGCRRGSAKRKPPPLFDTTRSTRTPSAANRGHRPLPLRPSLPARLRASRCRIPWSRLPQTLVFAF